MITESYLQKLVKEYAATPEGRRAIKEAYGIDYDPKFTKATAKRWGMKMRNLLFKQVSRVIKSITIDDIIVSDPYIGDDLLFRIDIYFDEGSLHRESLDPYRYPDGIANIVLLFKEGYHARGQVRGMWQTSKGEIYVKSKTDREPNDFLQKAVDAFNSEAAGIAIAQLTHRYR